jgi:hypothetical protein
VFGKLKQTVQLSSGRGRTGRNGGRGRGRGSGASNYSNNNSNRRSFDSKKDMMFRPHGVGQQQGATYATVKDYIVQLVQRTYDEGHDIAESLRNEVEKDLSLEAPEKEISTATNENTKKTEQESFDLIFREDMKDHLSRVRKLKKNMPKAYALIFSNFCSTTMQDRIEEHPDFEDKIRDNPIELLKAIKVLMHDPVRARYPFASLVDTIWLLMTTKQRDGESLLDYVKRFKEARDVIESQLGLKFLDEFVENLPEYRNEKNKTKQKALKDEAFGRLVSYLLLKNSDSAKYRSLVNGMQSQYSMGNDQYPKQIIEVTDILSNHRHDNADEIRKQRRADKSLKSGEKSTTEATKTG